MEQLSMEPNSNEDELKAIKEISVYNDLLHDMQGQIEKKNISSQNISIRIGKDYSSVTFRKMLIFRIKVRKTLHYISIPSMLQDVIGSEYTTKTLKSNPNYARIDIDPNNLSVIHPLVCNLVRVAIDRYPKEFDCCSRYLNCSDAKHCIQPNSDIALGCGYKKILESGRIFYGNNRNVD